MHGIPTRVAVPGTPQELIDEFGLPGREDGRGGGPAGSPEPPSLEGNGDDDPAGSSKPEPEDESMFDRDSDDDMEISSLHAKPIKPVDISYLSSLKLSSAVQDDAFHLIGSLGGSKTRYKRELKRGMKALMVEIYSPPRVTKIANLLPSLRCIPGLALDLTTVDPEDGEPWDFSLKEKRQKARKLINEQNPYIVVGSPDCSKFSAWQHVNKHLRDPRIMKRELDQAMVHLEFCCQIYRDQLNRGRYVLHEHPSGASSWHKGCIQGLLGHPRVEISEMHQCQYGAKAEDGRPIRKATKWMSTSPKILELLSDECQGHAEPAGSAKPRSGHAICRGNIARRAAIYSYKLCKTILVGIRRQLVEHCLVDQKFVGILGQEEIFRDDLTGQTLRPVMVHNARAVELDCFEDKDVWESVPVQERKNRAGRKPISVRWVDVNKGGDEHPNYRSRLVARDIRFKGDSATFAPTPPLEALNFVLSCAASTFDINKAQKDCETEPAGSDVHKVLFEHFSQHDRGVNSEQRTQISMLDIKRAYLNAKSDPQETCACSISA